VITDHYGRMLVTDTSGGALLVFTTDPLEMHQMFPVGASPYALAYDQATETVWVTLTASNEVVGYDLSTGIPEEVGRFATVRQPNSVTVDSRSGDLFVGSATGDGLQRIGAEERKRGQ
jgi:DNA-binding beta-propeller fold protein YncE